MPMLTHHPKFGAMFPSRARASRGFGDGQELLDTADKVIAAFHSAVASQEAQGLTFSLGGFLSLGQRLLSQATSQGLSGASALTLGVQLVALAQAYAKRGSGGSGGADATPDDGAGAPGGSGTTAPPAAASDSTGAVIALALAAGLVIFAVSR